VCTVNIEVAQDPSPFGNDEGGCLSLYAVTVPLWAARGQCLVSEVSRLTICETSSAKGGAAPTSLTHPGRVTTV
jgi:hypothetical protein